MVAGRGAGEAVVHGGGGHAATPHVSRGAVVRAAATGLRLRGVVAEATAPAEQAVL
ncbi:amidohydrolase, partial [Streptomyces griseus]|nr:amidohydrolase [Streptomyces griseus]